VPFCHLGHRHPGLDLSNTARHRCSVTVNSTNAQRSVTHVLIPMCHVGPETGQFPILRVSLEEFLYELKAGQRAASGRPRPATPRARCFLAQQGTRGWESDGRASSAEPGHCHRVT